jgi:hypothetical protein
MSSVRTHSANELTHFGRAREWHGDRQEAAQLGQEVDQARWHRRYTAGITAAITGAD